MADEYTACIAIWRGSYHVEISGWDEKEGFEFKDGSDMRPAYSRKGGGVPVRAGIYDSSTIKQPAAKA